jgi:flagellar biosynthesis/type III secretory pathway protein FliH
MTDACCAPSAAVGDLQNETDLLDAEDMLADPTMSSCCIREIKDRRRAESLRQKLSAVDISMQRQRAAASVLPIPPDLPQQQEADQGSDWERESDSQLEGLRVQRMEELKAQAREQASQQARGLGQLNDVPESNLLVRTW